MIKTMKNNKAFTLVELLIVVIIVAIIGAIVLQFVDSFARLLFYVFMYFAIPATIFGVALKLNQKYKWVVKKKYCKTPLGKDRFHYILYNGDYIDKNIIEINVWVFIVIWPLYLPGALAIIGVNEVYHRYLKDRFSIPEDK
jgi:prepilin-type N-terminal cleavage/methylation domain-containing protein